MFGEQRRVALGLFLSFLAFTYPVLRSNNARDPLANRWTDHQRYRYCAALVLRNPIHALTTPLDQLYAEDQGPHRTVTWGNEPCHEGGLVHVLLHAPIQWALSAELLSDASAVNIYVLFLLLAAHFSVFLLWRGEFWWMALLVYPFVVRCALSAVQEPIAFLLAVISAQRFRRGQWLSALAVASLAFSAYSRWIVWLVPMLWLAWQKRAEVLPTARVAWRVHRIIYSLVLLTFLWSCVAFVLAAIHRPPPGAGTDLTGRLAIAVLILIWAAHWRKKRDSQVAPMAISALLFLFFYNGWHMFWYVAPLLAAAPFVASTSEAVLWAIPAIVGSDLLLNREMTTHLGDIWRFVVDGWRTIFH